MKNTELTAVRTLSQSQLDEIKDLEQQCNVHEAIRIKFNWGMMRERDGAYVSDYCFYSDGRLVGYAPLDGFGGAYEVTAAVLPAYRRRGIFRLLLEAARREARNCNASELLLVSYPASPDGAATVAKLALPYQSSEYRMEANAPELPVLAGTPVELIEVTCENVDELSRLLSLSFENSRWNSEEALLKEIQSEEKRYFLARVDAETIGQVGVIAHSSGVYIRAVGIVPQRRGAGYGRKLLATTVQKMIDEGHTRFELDVATKNRQALSIYESCGFRESTVYDYWSVPLSD